MSDKETLIIQFIELLRGREVLPENGKQISSIISSVEELLERHDCMIDTQCREQLLFATPSYTETKHLLKKDLEELGYHTLTQSDAPFIKSGDVYLRPITHTFCTVDDLKAAFPVDNSYIVYSEPLKELPEEMRYNIHNLKDVEEITVKHKTKEGKLYTTTLKVDDGRPLPFKHLLPVTSPTPPDPSVDVSIRVLPKQINHKVSVRLYQREDVQPTSEPPSSDEILQKIAELSTT